jgi:hypothetical protein
MWAGRLELVVIALLIGAFVVQSYDQLLTIATDVIAKTLGM